MTTSVLLLLCLLATTFLSSSNAFMNSYIKTGPLPWTKSPRPFATFRTAATTVDTEQGSSLATIQAKIEAALAAGKNPEEYIQQLEARNECKEPNRSPQYLGEWHTWYTDSVPPSNGQLGPFRGTSRQVIRMDHTYQNILEVPPNDWLTAKLDAQWEEWDGRPVEGTAGSNETSTDSTDSTDWGASHWKVTFLRTRLALFGFNFFTKTFDPPKCRLWHTTYFDNETRVVRAGKMADAVVFYMKRTPPPAKW